MPIVRKQSRVEAQKRLRVKETGLGGLSLPDVDCVPGMPSTSLQDEGPNHKWGLCQNPS